MTNLVPVERLNELPRHNFTAALRSLFEDAEPLIERLYEARPFQSYEALLERAEGLLNDLPRREQVAVVNAHPRIGERPDAVRRVSEVSYREQGYAAEASLDSAEVARVYGRLAELNRQYEERFGFRFVVFVNGRPKSAIVKVLEERLSDSRGDELRVALREMVAIARDRLDALR